MKTIIFTARPNAIGEFEIRIQGKPIVFCRYSGSGSNGQITHKIRYGYTAYTVRITIHIKFFNFNHKTLGID